LVSERVRTYLYSVMPIFSRRYLLASWEGGHRGGV
jgi:hypothetical protein